MFVDVTGIYHMELALGAKKIISETLLDPLQQLEILKLLTSIRTFRILVKT